MLRWANEKDKPIIQHYSKNLFREKSRLFQVDLDQYELLIKNYVSNGWANYLVKEQDGELAGWILFGKYVDPLDGSERGFLYEMFVLPAFRRQGVGRLLMRTAMEELIRWGYSEIQLNVFAGNVGKKLYKELGFVDRQTLMVYKP